jgi:hypothetical protein
MLYTLKHLLVTIGLIGVVLPAGIGLTDALTEVIDLSENVRALCAIGTSDLAFFGLGWPLYRFMHLRPLRLPICPHCKKRHGNYHVPADAWPSGILICVSCGKPTRLYMNRKKPVDDGDGIPGLYLYWPEFVGFWRPVQDSTKNDVSE